MSRQWICVLLRGSFGLLRSREGWQDGRIAFEGLMTMIGLERQWRLTWTRQGDDRLVFVNEEWDGGGWRDIDEWTLTRHGD